MNRFRFKYLAIGFLVANMLVLSFGAYFVYTNDLLGTRLEAARQRPVPSRQVIEYIESIVKDVKPTPPEAARVYAYVASSYSLTLEKSDQSNALLASQKMINDLYPDRLLQTHQAIQKIYSASNIKETAQLSDPAKQALTRLEERTKTDGFSLQWDGEIPTGSGKWYVENNKQPLAPMAGQWKRWVVSGNFAVPIPPQYGSAADTQELGIVQAAVQGRTAAEVDKINFWGGIPGTETPAGIWQNQFYKTAKDELPFDLKKRDAIYANTQTVLAQTLADAFMECWKIKYTYWTARPSMRIPNLDKAMPNPAFPSYLSGHSTVSKAAAEVLAIMVPDKAAIWRQMAIDARDSRLVAGIHFQIDNTEGFNLGDKIASQVIQKEKLQPVLEPQP